MLQDMKKLRLEGNKDQFKSLFHQFMLDYQDTEELNVFLKNYGENGQVCSFHYWARCYNLGALPHNLHIERYHRSIKDWEMKPNIRIDQLPVDINFINNRYQEKETQLEYGLPMDHKYSQAQEEFLNCHVDLTEYKVNGNFFKTENF